MEAFQEERRQSIVSSNPTILIVESVEGDLVGMEQNPEGHPQTTEVLTEPPDKPNERGN